MRPLAIGLTVGDCNGVGPELALRAAARFSSRRRRLVLIGPRTIWEEVARQLWLPPPPAVADIGGGGLPAQCIWDPDPTVSARRQPGAPGRADAARAAYTAIVAAASAAMAGNLDAIVTAPISKEGFQRAGIGEPGHTELLARLTGARRYAMLLFGGRLRVVLVTRHLPLRRVAEAITPEAILEALELLVRALPWLGWPRGWIGVSALNPHAGDGGALGAEEQTVIRPAIRRARRRGWPVEGPIPADVLFYRHRRGDFAAVVAMYHDQGLAPLKMLSFDIGVNVTLGLPIVRTSPDHGTAYDLAGTGRANPASMCAALEWAARLAARPNPWAGRPRSGPRR